MLRLSKVRLGRERYYLETTVVGGSAPSGYIEPDGSFLGTLSVELAIDGLPVDREKLQTLFAGVDPRSGAVLDGRHRRTSIAAFDCTFASPKSVSVLHALAPADSVDAVRRAHDSAVGAVLAYFERNAAYVRRNGSLAQAEGFVAAAFLHRTSRAMDPHLHTHLLVANLSTDDETRWSAIDARPLFAQVGVAGSLYRAQLRNEISRSLGVSWKSRAEGFADVIGISPRALRGFSRRSAEIAAELERSGLVGQRAERVAADRTRPEKQTAIAYEVLVERWREQADTLGISRSVVRGIGQSQISERSTNSDEELVAEVGRSAGSFDRPFDRRELIRATCARLDAGAAVANIEAAVDSHLGSAALVRYGESRPQLRSIGAGRFPAGIVEERFVTPQTAEVARRLAVAFDEAVRLPLGGAESGDDRIAPGVYCVDRTEPPWRVYARLRELALQATAHGRGVVALGPSHVESAHLEGLTGIATAAWREILSLRHGTFVVVSELSRCPLSPAEALVDGAVQRGMTVVLAHRDRSRSWSAADLDSCRGRSDGSIEQHTVFDARLAIAPDLVGARSEVGRLVDAAHKSGRGALVVSADGHLAARADVAEVRPHELAWALRSMPGRDVIVFGSARLLGGALRHVADAQRVHVVVGPVDRNRRATYSLEVTEPSPIRTALGRFPEAPVARAAWRRQAAGLSLGRQIAGRELEFERGRFADRGRALERSSI